MFLTLFVAPACSWPWDTFVDARGDGGRDASPPTDVGVQDATNSGDSARPDAGETCAEVVAFDVAPDHLCTILAGGVLRCAGNNTTGSLGIGTTDPVEGFAAPVPGGPWREVATNATGTCALDMEQQLFCWGDTPPRLGLADESLDTTRPQRVTAETVPAFSRVALGGGHGCALSTASPLRSLCFGRNDFGQAGGPGTPVAPPRDVTESVLIAAGLFHTCSTRAGGFTFCWGRNDRGQLPSSMADLSRSPTMTGVRAFALAAGDNFTCALDDPGPRVRCWGDNRRGQSGLPPATSMVPVTDVQLDEAVVPVGIDAGAQHVCVRVGGGEIWCWGANNFGQLGRGIGVGPSDHIPAPALGGDYAEVRAGGDRTCARSTVGELFCWGRGSGTPSRVCVEPE